MADASLTTILSVASNYQRLVYDTASELYNEENDERSVRELREELIGEIRKSMKKVFDDLLLHSISKPFGSDTDSGTFYFEKGATKLIPLQKSFRRGKSGV